MSGRPARSAAKIGPDTRKVRPVPPMREGTARPWAWRRLRPRPRRTARARGRVGEAEQRLDQGDRDGPGADGETEGEEDRGHSDARPDGTGRVLLDHRSARHRATRSPFSAKLEKERAVASPDWARVHHLELGAGGDRPLAHSDVCGEPLAQSRAQPAAAAPTPSEAGPPRPPGTGSTARATRLALFGSESPAAPLRSGPTPRQRPRDGLLRGSPAQRLAPPADPRRPA